MVSLGPVDFVNPVGFYALASLIPLVLLYLIRPKPKQFAIPSLMFFFRNTGTSRLTSFLRNITRDWLFLIQLLLLLCLSLPFASPSTTVQHDVTADNTVIVLDVSASSQVIEGGLTRFQIGVAKAKELLGSQNTIVLAKEVPLIGISNADTGEATRYLNSLKPRDTGTRLGDAIILGGELLKGKEGRLIVISDFINTGGVDPETAKVVVQAQKTIVDFVNTATGQHRKNIGVTNLDVKPDTTTVFIHNFEPEQQAVTIRVGDLTKQLTIPGLATETFAFTTPSGKTEVQLDARDDFPLDNTAFISAPSAGKIRVLYVTSNASLFVTTALQANPAVQLTVAKLPILPKEDFDVYLLQNIAPREIVTGTFEDIAKRVEAGAIAIVHGQEQIESIDYKGLLPVRITGRGKTGAVQTQQPLGYTQSLDVAKADSYFEAQPIDDKTQVIVSVQTSPLVAVRKQGAGTTVWYGLLEQGTEFKYSPDYPIFWEEFLKSLTNQQDIRRLNHKTQDVLLLDREQDIVFPDGRRVHQASAVPELAGFYSLDGKTVAANLESDAESTINAEQKKGFGIRDFELRPVKQPRTISLDTVLLWIAGALVLFELLFVKLRGDL